jgi:hypothetical protein
MNANKLKIPQLVFTINYKIGSEFAWHALNGERMNNALNLLQKAFKSATIKNHSIW